MKAKAELMIDDELAELVGRIGNLYTKRGLALRDAAREWRGLSQEEIVAIIEKHFQDCHRKTLPGLPPLYIAGVGDQHLSHRAIEDQQGVGGQIFPATIWVKRLGGRGVGISRHPIHR
jgi:hypothetical protein